uniref:Uncharacterized protein LOC111132641 n=1 Tax=Crassostrea virginica TaxID=6565 RepID=A0A8B8E7R0_CRAVI|nr:uncharacterized protein LOC111132641 [Crassostrea virginica]
MLFFQLLFIFLCVQVIQYIEAVMPFNVNRRVKDGCYDNPDANCSSIHVTCDMQGYIYNYGNYEWAWDNCPVHCGFCQRITLNGPPPISTTPYTTKIVEPNTPPTLPHEGETNPGCYDNPILNCSSLRVICDMDGKYYNYHPYLWAQKHCPLHCGFCQKVCQNDPRSNCRLYNATALCNSNGAYYPWASRKCPAYCGLCHETTNLVQTTTDLVQTTQSRSIGKITNCS